MGRLESFLADVDRAWPTKSAPNKKLTLRIIGASALMVQTGYDRGTKDSDILETLDLTETVKSELLSIAGSGSALHARHRFYVELVPSGVPFLRQKPTWNSLEELNEELSHFRVEVLDVVDIVVAKLKRFHANDQADIEKMIEGGFVQHGAFVECFKGAVDVFAYDARADDLPDYVRRFNRVERDTFGTAETEIELPPWVDDQ